MENKWIKQNNGFGKFIHICPRCGERALEKLVWIDTVEEVQSNFCPNCGANDWMPFFREYDRKLDHYSCAYCGTRKEK